MSRLRYYNRELPIFSRRDTKVVEAEESDGCANCDWGINSCIRFVWEIRGKSDLKWSRKWLFWKQLDYYGKFWLLNGLKCNDSFGAYRNLLLLAPKGYLPANPSQRKPFKPEIPQYNSNNNNNKYYSFGNSSHPQKGSVNQVNSIVPKGHCFAPVLQSNSNLNDNYTYIVNNGNWEWVESGDNIAGVWYV